MSRARVCCFVTGTDTGIGKTWVSAGLLTALAASGRRVAGMKPVASGSEMTPAGPRNADALLLQAHSTPGLAYHDVNPVALMAPVAPHIAAAQEGSRIDLGLVTRSFRTLEARADAVVVEGIGGWRVPFQDGQGARDLVRELSLPVLLVVGLRLGCINHALLTAEAILRDDVRLAGWVANHPWPPADEAREIVNYLSEQIPAPLLGCVPHLDEFSAEQIAASLAVDLLEST